MIQPKPCRHIALVGATGTGKTALAVKLAGTIADLELISVDAMAVYRGLDIGTAKPSGADRDNYRWHLLDIVDPQEEFSVSTFQTLFQEAISDIELRGKRAVLVGGTGLYHRAIIDNLQLPPRYEDIAEELRQKWLKPQGPEDLYELLVKLDKDAADLILPNNMRRIIRALEVTLGSGKPFSSFGPGLKTYEPNNIALFGLYADRQDLNERLAKRLDAQLGAGFIDEVKMLYQSGPVSKTAGQAIGYAEIFEYLNGQATLEEAKDKILKRTRTYAKRQESWFRRDPRLHWLKGNDEENFRIIYKYMTENH